MSERKPIDPALRRFLDTPAAPPLAEMADEERVRAGRALMEGAAASRGSIPGLPNRVETEDVWMTGTLAGRCYRPPGAAGPLPVLVYLHGGGWVFGSVETHDPFCRLLSEAAGVLVLSVEYRLAPEHPYPAALEDTLAAFRWARERVAGWNGDPRRIALGGDSAGGNLAAVAANQLCAPESDAGPQALLLLYPATDHPDAGHPSYTENAIGYGLEANGMRWFWQQYAPGISPDEAGLRPRRAARIPALPPTLLATAEYDVLRDEGIAYAQKLRTAGVDVTHLHAADMHHNFPVHPATVARFPQSEATLLEIARWLRATLGRPLWAGEATDSE